MHSGKCIKSHVYRAQWIFTNECTLVISPQIALFYFLLKYSWFTMIWEFQVYSKVIQYLMLLSCSVVSNSLRPPWTAARQASLSPSPGVGSKLMSIELVMLSNHLILCCPLLLLPSILPRIRVLSNELALRNRWPKYWSFNFNISPSNEHPGLISFSMGWLDLLAVQGTLKSLLQHHSSKASILQCSASFTVQLTHPYMTTGKTRALTGKIQKTSAGSSWKHAS